MLDIPNLTHCLCMTLVTVTYLAGTVHGNGLVPVSGDTVCVGHPLVIVNANIYEKFTDAKCTHLRGSLQFGEVDLSGFEQASLSLKTITGTLTITAKNATNRDSIENILNRTCVGCIGASKAERMKTRCSENCTTASGDEVTAANKADMMQNWTENGCPDITHISFENGIVKTQQYPPVDESILKENGLLQNGKFQCSQAYNCSLWGMTWNTTSPEPCVRACEIKYPVITMKSLCNIPIGCTSIIGHLEIFVSGSVARRSLPPACQTKLECLGEEEDDCKRDRKERCEKEISTESSEHNTQAILKEFFGKVVTIEGKLIIMHTENVYNLDFLRSLTNVHGKNKIYDQFDTCHVRHVSAIIIIETLMTNVSHLGHVVIGPRKIITITDNKYLCDHHFHIGVCNESRCNGSQCYGTQCNGSQCGGSRCDLSRNGALGACAVFNSTVNQSTGILSWVNDKGSEMLQMSVSSGANYLRNNTCAISYVIFYKALEDMADEDDELDNETLGSDVCTDSSTGWLLLGLVEHTNMTLMDLNNHVQTMSERNRALGPCSTFMFVICAHSLRESGELLADANSIAVNTFRTRPIGLKFNVTISVDGCPNNNSIIAAVDVAFNGSAFENQTFHHILFSVTVKQNETVRTNFNTSQNYTVSDPCEAHPVSINIPEVNLVGLYQLSMKVCYNDNGRCSTRPHEVNSICSRIGSDGPSSTQSGDAGGPDPDDLWSLFCLLIVVLMVVIILYLLHRRRKDKKKFKARLSIEMLKNRQLVSDYEVPLDEEYQYDSEWELVADSVHIIREVGEGAFGKVFEGVLATVEDGDLKVAVKTLAHLDSPAHRNAFLNEACIMKKFDSPHVVKLMGLVSVDTANPLVVMELMGNGDLRTYLMQCRPQEENVFFRSSTATTSTSNGTMGTPGVDLYLQWATQLAKGMMHLHEKHFVHRDLAARNCMLAMDLTLKVGDFGLTRDIYESDYYRKQGRGALPVRWMAPESLRDGIYIPASDVWSYGIVLWEMATLGAQPYRGKGHEDLIAFIISGGRMDVPIVIHEFPDVLCRLMADSWTFIAQDRPPFEQIVEMLQSNPGSEQDVRGESELPEPFSPCSDLF